MFDPTLLKEVKKTTESRVVIRFQDCDPLRHLNNAKYFDYFFNAREDQVPKLYGVEVMDFINAYKSAWVVYQHRIAYVRPANVGEWVRIYSRIAWFNEDTVMIEYFMTDDSGSQLKTLLWTTMKYIDINTGQKVQHQGVVKQYLETIAVNDFDPKVEDFDHRVKAIKQQLPHIS
jgi:acyl-CoA thioester hydrolase